MVLESERNTVSYVFRGEWEDWTKAVGSETRDSSPISWARSPKQISPFCYLRQCLTASFYFILLDKILREFCLKLICLFLFVCFPCHKCKQWYIFVRKQIAARAMDWGHVQLWQDSERAEYHKRANKTKPLKMKWRNFHPPDLLFGCLEWNTHIAKIALKSCPSSWLRDCHFHPWKHYFKRLPCLQGLKDFQKHSVLGAGKIPSHLNCVVWLNLNAESFPLISF